MMVCSVCGRTYLRADAYDGDLCPFGCVPEDEGYELDDPKHSGYYDRVADAADIARKQAKGE